jgi:beta-fructofuranosidase
MLRLEDDWVWDSWIADDGERYHLFFLKAPRALGDPGLRHRRAVIGHASSMDLVDWRIEPDALHPLPGSWDDLALWTGSVVRGEDGVWRLYYTALGTRGHETRDQRIGLAESDDLMEWRRVGDRPIAAVDPRWYKTLEEDETASETWRDPFVFQDDDGGGGWHMLITARILGAPRKADGVLAHGRSSDMRSWEIGPPLTVPAGFGQLEVPQVRRMGSRCVLLFTCSPQEQTEQWIARFGPHSTWSLSGDSMLGPWDLADARPFEADPTLFAARLVQRRGGTWALLGFRNLEPDGISPFEVLDPIEVELDGGRLVAARDHVPFGV